MNEFAKSQIDSSGYRIRDGMIFKFQDSSHVQKQMENINISSVCDA